MHLTPTPRQLNQPFFRVLRWGFVALPLPALLLGCVAGAEIGVLGFLLGLVAIVFGAWGVVGFNLVRHHFAERKAAHEVLQHLKVCKRLKPPRTSILVGGLVMVGGSLPFLLGAARFAEKSGDGAWLVAGVLMLTALLLQWIGAQRVSDYLLIKRAWQDGQED